MREASELSFCGPPGEGAAPAGGSPQDRAAAPVQARCPGDRDDPERGHCEEVVALHS